MVLIVCVDDDNGMMFNHRRQSRDKALIDYILHMTQTSRLWMSRYSAELFNATENPQVCVDDSFLSKASSGEYCFVEDVALPLNESTAEKIMLYKWNRCYPSDLRFGIDLSEWRLKSTLDFPGSSHERITEEVYIR